MSSDGKLPGWLAPANPGATTLRPSFGHRMRLASVPGRTSGRLRATPVSSITVDEAGHHVAALEGADRGIRARGHRKERVALFELPVEERGALPQAFPRKVPPRVHSFHCSCGASDDPEAFAALAPRRPVF